MPVDKTGVKPEDQELDRDDEDQDDEDQQDDLDENDDDEDEEDGGTPDPKDKKIRDLTEARNRNVKKRKEAQARVAELEQELAAERASKSEDPDALNAANQTVTDLTAQVRDLTLQNRLLTNTAHTWVDPEAVLRLVDLSDVEFNDDGTVDGLDEALEALAAKSPYLLAAAPKDGDDDEEKPRRRKTGDSPRQRKNPQTQKAAEDARLRAKYPGLRK